jgi:hypothetical protein
VPADLFYISFPAMSQVFTFLPVVFYIFCPCHSVSSGPVFPVPFCFDCFIPPFLLWIFCFDYFIPPFLLWIFCLDYFIQDRMCLLTCSIYPLQQCPRFLHSFLSSSIFSVLAILSVQGLSFLFLSQILVLAIYPGTF